MMAKELESREDVFLLVSTFYSKVKKDETIGEFFTTTIPEESWDKHIDRLTDFWETNLFFVRKFKGDPIKAHRNVDKDFRFIISQEHFGKWLQLWFTSVDELFIGDKANQAKERARNIASILFFKLFSEKPKEIM